MAYRPLSCVASLAFMAALTFAGTECTTAAEQLIGGLRVVSSDETSRFVALAVNKSLVIDLPKDVNDALVANPKIVNAVVRTKRRVYLVGHAIGQTNVYFYDDDGRQIGALDVYVTSGTPPASMNAGEALHEVVVVYRGAEGKYTTQRCSPSACVAPAESLPELPAGYTNISNNSIK
jgi:Flp pilus assembly secretin CpaC